MAATISRLRLPAPVQDAVLAAFVTYFQIRGTLLVAAGEPVARPLREPHGLGYALLVISGAALLARRRWPAGVFAVVAAADAGYYLLGFPDGPGWVGLFVALYTVTAYGDGRRSLAVAAAGIGALSIVWLSTADLWPLTGAGWVFFRPGTAVMAAALGESARARRAQVAELVRKAARAERDREIEARQRVDAERLRIAREVHDTVAHAITVINLHAGAAAHVLERRPERVREALATIERTSARALDELRATLGALRGSGDDADVPAPGLDRIEEIVAMGRDAGLHVKLRVAGVPRDAPDAIGQAAYRIVQEAITNVVRHAGAASATVALTYEPGHLGIRVTDDGRNAPARTDESGRGLVGMGERCGLLGGELRAGPRPDGGFEVAARLPLPVTTGVPV